MPSEWASLNRSGMTVVIGGLMEDNLRRALLIYDDSIAFMWERPLTLGINITTLFILFFPMLRSFIGARKNHQEPVAAS